ALAPLADRFILVAPPTPRAAAPEALRPLVPATVPSVEIAGSPSDALACAGRLATTPVICVAGSLFLIGEVLRELAGSAKPCELERRPASMSLPFGRGPLLILMTRARVSIAVVLLASVAWVFPPPLAGAQTRPQSPTRAPTQTQTPAPTPAQPQPQKQLTT